MPYKENVLRVSVGIVNPVTMDLKFVFLTVKLHYTGSSEYESRQSQVQVVHL